MANIEESLKNRIHNCKDMPLYYRVLCTPTDVYEMRFNSTEVFVGKLTDWLRCPFCGIYFYEGVK